MSTATLTKALVTRFRKTSRAWLLLRRKALAMRLVSIGVLIERTQEEIESDRLLAAHRQREHQEELAELARLRDALCHELCQVRQELAK